MPTFLQLLKKSVRKIKKKRKLSALEGCPQKAAQCISVFVTTPKKPNSALRKVARVSLISTRKKITVHIPGLSPSLQKHATVLIRGGRVKDLPGIRYRVVRGANRYALEGIIFYSRSRSKYGTKSLLLIRQKRLNGIKRKVWFNYGGQKRRR